MCADLSDSGRHGCVWNLDAELSDVWYVSSSVGTHSDVVIVFLVEEFLRVSHDYGGNNF